MRVDVSEVIDESPIGGFHWVVVILGAIITVIDGFDLVAMGMVVPTLSEEWGLDPSAFSTALSAALFGVLFGSAAAGTLGDMIGRRWTLIIMIVICAVFMSLSAIVTSMNELIIYRFFTGVGAGGSIPVAIALTSEYMPARHRNTLVTLMYAGAALGSVMGGFVGPSLIERFGWEGIFILGGVLPAIAGVFLLFLLPESLRFIVTKRSDNTKARQLIRRINPQFQTNDDQEYFVKEVTHEGAAIRELFGGKQTIITLVIWFVFFANQFLIFFVGLWLPTVFTEAGLALASALFLLAIYNLGGACGGPVFGFFERSIQCTACAESDLSTGGHWCCGFRVRYCIRVSIAYCCFCCWRCRNWVVLMFGFADRIFVSNTSTIYWSRLGAECGSRRFHFGTAHWRFSDWSRNQILLFHRRGCSSACCHWYFCFVFVNAGPDVGF